MAEPLAFGAGVKVRSPVALERAGPAANRAEAPWVTRKLNAWPASSAAASGPGRRLEANPAAVKAPKSSVTVSVVEASVKEGGSFTAPTVRVKVLSPDWSWPPFAVPPSSVARTKTCATPLASAAGVKVKSPAAFTAG